MNATTERPTTQLSELQAGSFARAARPQQAMQTSGSQIFSSLENMREAQHVAKLFAASDLVPKSFQGDSPKAIANCVIALDMAMRLRANPLMVMQNLYIVHGKPAWSGQFVIAAINQSGRFRDPLEFIEVGEKGADSWGFYATTTTNSGREIHGPTVTIGMAKAEGWFQKDGSKWKTMPELMLRYRAGSFFGRSECPELLMGMQTDDEIRDVINIDPDTGEILGGGPERPVDLASLVPQAGSAVIDNATIVVDEQPPMVATDRDAALQVQGWYEDGNRKFNAHGEMWDQAVHATSADGLPIVNKDGHFKARRGISAQTEAKPEQIEPPEPVQAQAEAGETAQVASWDLE